MVKHQQAEERVNAGFWIHLTCYIVVVSALAVLNYQRNPDNLWVLWVAGGWGIGIVAHAVAFFTNRGKLIDRVETRMDRREERQERREEGRDASHISEKMGQASK
ncbi:MAG: 2TM domain-containing protein [Planctomycetaceae bacterium]